MNHFSLPSYPIDVVLDTDTYNEIDDQFALAYLLSSKQTLHTKAIYAAPFFNSHSESPADGMEKSYAEIHKVLNLMQESYPTFRGSDRYLPDETTPVLSDAAKDLAERAMQYSAEQPLYVVAIGAITNIASAILLRPEICDRIVLVWLGGHALHWQDTKEFNMIQDIAAARVVMQSEAPLVQLPCFGVVSEFRISEPELRFWFENTTPIGSYLAENTIREASSYAANRPWTRVIWDVTAVAWLLNENNRFMRGREIPVHLPEYSGVYAETPINKTLFYVEHIERDALMEDMIHKIRGNK